ncbi:hypothetical protein GGI43DRAFT_378885 [Trichoderma evansii]
MPIIVFPAARRKGKREKEKGHYAVVASPLQPHLCDKDTARQVTAPVDQEPSEVLQVTGGLSGTVAARGSVLKFWRPSTSVAGSDTLARLAGPRRLTMEDYAQGRCYFGVSLVCATSDHMTHSARPGKPDCRGC